jgi:hypothetical protein
MPVKKQNPELLALKRQIKSDASTISFRINRIAIKVGNEPEGYLMQMIKWSLEDIENNLKEDIKRYYKLKQF